MRHQPPRRRLSFQALENRRVLANVMVTTGADVVDANDGEISLREAVDLANADPDASTIRFADSLIDSNPSDELNLSIELDSQLEITESVSIIGADRARISITGKDTSRIFEFNGGANKQFVIEGLTLAHGKSDEFGGAIRVSGIEFVLRESVIRNSEASSGGAIAAAFGEVRIERSSIVDNQAEFGGGVFLQNAKAIVSNLTVSGNTATSVAGGIVSLGAGTDAENSLTLIHSTITNNDGPSGNIENSTQQGALSSTLEILNSIIAEPNGGPNLVNSGSGATQVSLGGNVIDDGSGTFDASLGDLRADPMLEPLAYDFNSGQYVHRLPAGSPAAGTGIQTGRPEHAQDQTGQQRFFLGAFSAGAIQRSAITVTTTADTIDPNDGEVSLREAVTFTNTQQDVTTIEFSRQLDGQPITLTRTGSSEDGNLTGDIDFNQNDLVNVLGNGRENTIISGGGDSGIGESVFNVRQRADIFMESLTIRDGRATSGLNVGGAIADQTTTDGSLTLDDVRLTGNQATSSGGAIVVADTGRTTIRNSLLDNNSAARGGAVATFGTLTITDSTLRDNTVTAVGGAIQAQDSLAIVQINTSTISGNDAGFAGGGIANVQGDVTINTSTLSDNTGERLGGAVFTVGNQLDASATTRILQSTITNNDTQGNGSGPFTHKAKASMCPRWSRS